MNLTVEEKRLLISALMVYIERWDHWLSKRERVVKLTDTVSAKDRLVREELQQDIFIAQAHKAAADRLRDQIAESLDVFELNETIRETCK